MLDLCTGPSGLPLRDVFRALTGAEVARGTGVIIWQVRLPVALMALVVGAALGLAGAEMQTVLKNPLAEPFTLGVSSAAALGAAAVIVLGASLPWISGEWAIAASAFVFALGALGLLQMLAGIRGGGAEVMILFGIALSFTAAAFLSLLQFVASADALQQLVFWTMGSLSGARWPSVALVGIALVLTVPFSFASAWKLTALRLGEDRARSLGIDVRRLRFGSLFMVSLLAATSVAFVGAIGFIGLVGPHIARLLIGEDHRFFLPASALTGAVVMSLADIASKSIAPGAIVPIGIVTSLVGLPVFFSLILRRRERL